MRQANQETRYVLDVDVMLFFGVAAGVGVVLAVTEELGLLVVLEGVTLRIGAEVEVGPDAMLLAGVPFVLGESDPTVEDRRDERSSMS